MIGKEENIHCSSSTYRSARIISYLLDGSVLVFPIFLSICFYSQDDLRAGVIGFAISVFFASMLPYSFIIFLYKKKVINDLHLPRRKDRILPITVSLTSLVIGYFFLDLAGSFMFLRQVFLVYIINLVMVGLITLRWKISFHASYVTLFSVIFLYIYGTSAIPVLLLVPLVGWARIVMRRHTVSQVIAGTLTTGMLSAAAFYFRDHPGKLQLRPEVIAGIFRTSPAGSINMSLVFTYLFVIFAGQYKRFQEKY